MASVAPSKHLEPEDSNTCWNEAEWLTVQAPLIVPLDEDGWHAVFPQGASATALPALVIVRVVAGVFELLVCETDDPAVIGRFPSVRAASVAATRWLRQQEAALPIAPPSVLPWAISAPA